VRVWVDLTNSPHVLVLRPVIEALRADGHELEITARDFAQTLGLAERFGLEVTPIGRHRGSRVAAKALGLAERSLALARWARGRRFDLALGHGSNDVTVAARLLRIPSSTTFDYEWATVQHNVNCRLAQAVVVPDAIPPERLERYGVGPDKLVQYAGLKEEYYLSDFVPDPGEFDRLGVDREKVVVIVRPPPEVSLYHRKSNQLFPRVLERLGRNEDVSAVVIPRTLAQREHLLSAGLPSVIVPADAVDAQSLIALADLVVSAGGTMNREAVALGTPVYTTFGGRLGGVDEQLIREGRLRPLTDERAIELVKQREERHIARRDPAILTEMILGAAA
jgi:predicted glycosyltransferase